jgi:DNA invertase Pin-like site-specific DNA recombinase
VGELIGYARVSTRNQNFDAQLDAVCAAACSRIFAEAASGAKCVRPPLAAARAPLASGHTTTAAARAIGVGRATVYRHLATAAA